MGGRFCVCQATGERSRAVPARSRQRPAGYFDATPKIRPNSLAQSPGNRTFSLRLLQRLVKKRTGTKTKKYLKLGFRDEKVCSCGPFCLCVVCRRSLVASANDLMISGQLQFDADCGVDYDLHDYDRTRGRVSELDFSHQGRLDSDYRASTKSGLEYGTHSASLPAQSKRRLAG